MALLLTELLGESGPGSAPAQHYEVLDEVITGAGGVRPLYQGAGRAPSAFSRPAAAIGAAVAAQRRLAAELPGLSVRMAVHVDGVHRRDTGATSAGPSRGMRLRACGHGGQILVSETGPPPSGATCLDGVTLVDLGPARLDGDDRTERVWQVVHPDLRSTFPALGSASISGRPRRRSVSPRRASRRSCHVRHAAPCAEHRPAPSPPTPTPPPQPGCGRRPGRARRGGPRRRPRSARTAAVDGPGVLARGNGADRPHLPGPAGDHRGRARRGRHRHPGDDVIAAIGPDIEVWANPGDDLVCAVRASG
ncbi:MAG: hypothetical protein R2726_20515 [Acidimicrobiales bacterium]